MNCSPPLLSKSVAILTGPATHLDHLGILSALLEIPLIVTEESTFQLAKHYYPQINATLMELSDLSMDYLCSHFDVLFESGKFWALELKPFMKLLHNKNMRFIFCPHGNSDKGHSLTHHPDQDISLVYGNHLYTHLEKTGALVNTRATIATGNYRYPFYRKFSTFYDELADIEVFSHFTHSKPTILYAPTWHGKENPTSCFKATEKIISQLGNDYNLIIKFHPFLIEDFPGKILNLIHRYEKHPSVHFIEQFPPIYPLLKRCDIYLGDYSSIGYDFLSFDKPLYFYRPRHSPSDLSACGITIPDTQIDRLLSFFQETLTRAQSDFSAARKELYAHTFGEEKQASELRAAIATSLL